MKKLIEYTKILRSKNAGPLFITFDLIFNDCESMKYVLNTLTKEQIAAAYEVLLRELTLYNPELLDKSRLLAITKCDMIDDEMAEQMRAQIPEGIPSIFISSVSGMGIQQLKDMLWDALNA